MDTQNEWEPSGGSWAEPPGRSSPWAGGTGGSSWGGERSCPRVAWTMLLSSWRLFLCPRTEINSPGTILGEDVEVAHGILNQPALGKD